MRQDTRRGTRTAVHTIGAIWMLGLLTYSFIALPPEKLLLPSLFMLFILFWRELMHGIENVAARVKFSFGKDGASGEIER